MKKENEDIIELNKMMLDHCIKKNIDPTDMITFLTGNLIKIMSIHGYTKEYFDHSCEGMKNTFREKQYRIHCESYEKGSGIPDGGK